MLGIRSPSVALFGINPHASEGGLFGPQDEAIVVPAAKRLRDPARVLNPRSFGLHRLP